MSFSGKVVLVTGASSGIGAATALLFAREGARVALVARNKAKLDIVAQQCAQHGAPPLIIKADIANEQEASTLVQKTVDHFGKLDILLNIAGILRHASVDDPNSLKVFDEVMNTNLRAIVQLTSHAAPHLKVTKGNIVNVSSISSVQCNVDVEWIPWCSGAAALARAIHIAPRVLAGRVLYRGTHLLGSVPAPAHRCHIVMLGRPFAVNTYELLVLAESP